MEGSFFTRMVDMYKSIVVFMLTGGKTVLVPVFYDNYFLATLQLLEKLHKVSILLPGRGNVSLLKRAVTIKAISFFLFIAGDMIIKLECSFRIAGDSY